MIIFYIYAYFTYLCVLKHKIMKLNIEKVMKKKGITAITLSEEMSKKDTPLRRESIGSIIRGVTSPKLDTLQDIANALEVPLFALFDDYTPNDMEPLYRKDESGEYVAIGFIKV